MRELRKETETFNISSEYYTIFVAFIRNERTPKGDGNLTKYFTITTSIYGIRNERTPKGDGNFYKMVGL